MPVACYQLTHGAVQQLTERARLPLPTVTGNRLSAARLPAAAEISDLLPAGLVVERRSGRRSAAGD